MAPSTRSPLPACRAALIEGFSRSASHVPLDNKGYVGEARQNLLDGVNLGDFEDDLRQGDGNELGGKFRAAHSSSALAINNFAPFKSDMTALRILGSNGFTGLSFERKCPHGLAGRRSPNLDVLAEGTNGILAIESKCLEYLSPHVATFSPAYDKEIVDERRGTAWFGEAQRLIREPRSYRWLDAAQLVKHAFGLAYTFPQRPTTLLYLFWEPSNPEGHQVFAEHRAELERFRAATYSGGVAFVSMCYTELWASWDSDGAPAWLPLHLSRLRTRYLVSF